MKVDLEYTFTADEIRQMVLERLKNVETCCEGAFKVHCRYGYIPEVVATFVPKHAEETPDDMQQPMIFRGVRACMEGEGVKEELPEMLPSIDMAPTESDEMAF